METMTVAVVGTSPLLCNSPRGMEPDDPKGKTRQQATPKAEIEAERGTYPYDDGEYGFPIAGFVKCTIQAASNKKVGRTSLATILKGAIFSDITAGELTRLDDPETGDPLTDYVIDTRRCVLKATKGAILRSRPRFDDWATSGIAIEYDETQTNEGMILELLSEGGKRVGVGNFSPRWGGPFGRFKVL